MVAIKLVMFSDRFPEPDLYGFFPHGSTRHVPRRTSPETRRAHRHKLAKERGKDRQRGGDEVPGRFPPSSPGHEILSAILDRRTVIDRLTSGASRPMRRCFPPVSRCAARCFACCSPCAHSSQDGTLDICRPECISRSWLLSVVFVHARTWRSVAPHESCQTSTQFVVLPQRANLQGDPGGKPARIKHLPRVWNCQLSRHYILGLRSVCKAAHGLHAAPAIFYYWVGVKIAATPRAMTARHPLEHYLLGPVGSF